MSEAGGSLKLISANEWHDGLQVLGQGVLERRHRVLFELILFAEAGAVGHGVRAQRSSGPSSGQGRMSLAIKFLQKIIN